MKHKSVKLQANRKSHKRIHSISKSSSTKTSKLYKKKYRGQGR